MSECALEKRPPISLRQCPHVSAVERAGLGSLNEGQKLSFELEQGKDGKSSAGELKAL